MVTTLPRVQIAALLSMVAMLAGCAQPTPPAAAQHAAAPLTLKTRLHTESHRLALGPDGRASALERNRLAAFIADLATPRRDALHARVSGTGNDMQLLAAARMLAEDGLNPANIVMVPARETATGPVTIEVEQYSVDKPACAPWGTVVSASDDNSVERPELGCSNLTNLGAMVSDPRDLMRGSTTPYADGITSAAAVQRYNEDNVKPLPQFSGFGATPKDSGGGGGGAGKSGASGSSGGM